MTNSINRPQTTVVLAMSADGKIADKARSPARFASAQDKAHLETQIAIADGVIFGSNTLTAYGTTMRVSSPQLLKMRESQGKLPQPIQIVCSRSHYFDLDLRFFQQPVPRWLLTASVAEEKQELISKFDRILIASMPNGDIDWHQAFQQLANLGLQRLAILGGGKLVASLLAADLIDELWLTVCPLILGGTDAPTPVAGEGFLGNLAPQLELLEVQQVDQEVFLHYRLIRKN
ncbi:MAG TPA: RibD family protein [Kamptonema sp.]|nr:RibD family protein [Kamptonema sp.]